MSDLELQSKETEAAAAEGNSTTNVALTVTVNKDIEARHDGSTSSETSGPNTVASTPIPFPSQEKTAETACSELKGPAKIMVGDGVIIQSDKNSQSVEREQVISTVKSSDLPFCNETRNVASFADIADTHVNQQAQPSVNVPDSEIKMTDCIDESNTHDKEDSGSTDIVSSEQLQTSAFQDMQGSTAVTTDAALGIESSSESDSISTDDSEPDFAEREEDSGNEEDEKESQKGRSQVKNLRAGPTVEGELTIYDLPPIEDLKISLDENVELTELGSVMSFVDGLVIIKSNPNVSPLDEDTVLFLDRSRTLGKVFETFGPVVSPFYSVRFNSSGDIARLCIKVGDKIYFAPSEGPQLTHYVFMAHVAQQKGSDASWLQNHEVPAEHQDYSDDEEERRARSLRGAKQHRPDGAGADDSSLLQKKQRKPRKNRNNPHGSGQTQYGQPDSYYNNQPSTSSHVWNGPDPNYHPSQAYGNQRGQGSYRPTHPQFGGSARFNHPHYYGQQNHSYNSNYWSGYNSQWTRQDSNYYAKPQQDENKPKFVDSRFIQNKPS